MSTLTFQLDKINSPEHSKDRFNVLSQQNDLVAADDPNFLKAQVLHFQNKLKKSRQLLTELHTNMCVQRIKL